MKKVLAMILAAAMVLALCACGSTAAPAATEAPAQEAQTNEQPAAEKTEAELLDECEPVVITLGQNDSGDVPPVKGAEAMIAAIEERSGGKITFDYHNGGTLGNYVEMTESMAMGGLDMGVLDPTLMTEYSPEIPMLVQPFLIKDYEHFGKVLALPEVRDCEAALAENNITVLGYFYAGFRAMCFTNKEVKNVEDCKGIIIRSPEADIYMNTLKRLGMSPTPMAMPEMYQAMKQGVIEVPPYDSPEVLKGETLC